MLERKRMLRPLQERFDERWSKDHETGCHNWIGSGNHRGYGRIHVNGKNLMAHRVAWMLAHGPVPPQMFVCHKCDNVRCVNVAHLFVGTNADNVADCVAKGRFSRGAAHSARTPHGEANGSSWITDAQVADMRARFASGVSQGQLAREHGCRQQTVSRIVRGERRTQ